MKIRNLRTNHLENPLGYLMKSPMLTWTAEDSTGTVQRGARVQVASDEAFQDILYDSGMRGDISALGFVPDLALAPRTRYWWRVEVVADDGDRALSEAAWFETGKREEPWAAQWVRAPFDAGVHPILERSFDLPAKPVRARVYAAGLGVYELVLNGETVGDEVLAPFYNDYNLWIQYQTYDVTDLLGAGANRLDAWLGNGWYRGRFGFGDRTEEIYGDRMQLMLELRAEMPDGTEIVIGTDPQWSCRPSPVLASNIYDGETYDARLEAAEARVPAVPAQPPVGPLSERLSPPLRRCDRLAVQALLHTPAGELVLDFGQVMTGWVELDCDLPEGCTVTLEFGELLQRGNFYQENLRSAKQRFDYTSSGKPARVRPHFTFYGFRYVRVTGMACMRPEAFVAQVIHSDLAVTGSIETSNPKVNQLFRNAYWGQIGNFLDVPTDCPQRDERMGWTGDAHVFAPTASFNMYTPAFYEKYLYDMRLEQRQLGGAVPHVVPDVIDQIERAKRGNPHPDAFGSCGWGDAAIGIPWTMYEFFGDRDMLARQYENMKMWTDWIREQDETRCGGRRLWTCGFHYADWLALDNPVQGSSFGGTDPYYIASAYYYNAARTTSRAARALGRDGEADAYARLADEVRDAFRKEFFTPAGRVAERTQTALVIALHMDLVPEEHRERVRADLRQLIAARGDHLDTGFLGTYYLCRTLTENGMGDLAYTLLLNEDYPSWLYEVNMGATTVWERWNSVLPNGLVSDTGMNSMNHYAYGSVVEWMYRCMCGINPAEPGFRRARIAPVVDRRFQWVSGSYDSAAGIYECGWRFERDGQILYEVAVPFNCEADFVADCDGRWKVNGADAAVDDGVIRLRAGKYRIVRA